MEFAIKLRNLYYTFFKVKKKITNISNNFLSIYIINGLARSYSVSFDKYKNIFIPDMPANNIVKLNKEVKVTGVYDIKEKMFINCSYIGKINKKQHNDTGLVSPHFITFDKLENFYIAEFNAGRISIFSKDMKLKNRFYCVKKPVSIFIENRVFIYGN